MLFLVTGTVWVNTYASSYTRLVMAHDWLGAVQAFKKDFESKSTEKCKIIVEDNVAAYPTIIGEEKPVP